MKLWMENQQKNVRAYFIRPRRIALVYTLVTAVVLLVVWWHVGGIIEKRLLQEERLQISAQVDSIGTSLTLAVNQRLMLITSVSSYVETKVARHPVSGSSDIVGFNDLDGFISNLYTSTVGIRNIAIAPNGMMQYVYPYEENKAVLGYEPARDERPDVRGEVRRAIETGNIVLSLPYELIQGGQGLIARQAITVNDAYWGLANLVLDVPPLLEEAGISSVPSGLELALKDQSGQVFFGPDYIYMLEPVIYMVKLPEGSWELAGVPSAGWHEGFVSAMWFYRVMGITGIFAISLVVYLFTNRRERLAYLVEHRTHELAQSNQTLINVLEGIDADVYVADIDTFEILFANRHLRESFNVDLLGKKCYSAFRHRSLICVHCMNDKLFDDNGQPNNPYVWKDSNPITGRWYQNADRAIRWHDGRYVHLQIATDITEQKQAEDAIRESEERYRNLFDSVPVGIYRSTPDGRFLDGNPALVKILGYPDQEIMLASNIKDLFLSDGTREQELALIEQDEFVSNYRLQLRRYDGAIIWVQDSSNVIRNSSGQTMYYYGRLEDITERVQAEETLLEAENGLKSLLQEKDILLAEVHHRVKNNMQVITSLLSLQADEFADESIRKVYEESRSRINSMALVHEQLYRSKEYARIEFGPYIDQLATSLFNSYNVEPENINLTIDADDVYLDLERAIPCGLLLNELITNSLKYAFPNSENGQLLISLKPEKDKIKLTFSDNGVGLSDNLDLENIQSLGLQLVHLLVIHDLRGSIAFESKAGTQFSIEFPLS